MKRNGFSTDKSTYKLMFGFSFIGEKQVSPVNFSSTEGVPLSSQLSLYFSPSSRHSPYSHSTLSLLHLILNVLHYFNEKNGQRDDSNIVEIFKIIPKLYVTCNF